MAFDQPTRNRLARFVGEARGVLSEEFTRQLQHEYGLDPASGEVTELQKLTHLDDGRRETARLLRDTMEHYLAAGAGQGIRARKEILDRIVREQAFTVLNRLCALRMAEARGLLIESIAKGHQSKGFQLYARLAGTALGETGDAYRCYLFSVFDEFAVDLPVLFDRFNPQGRLFPRDTVLLQLLDRLNHPDLEALWAEDETIGWIYQYFNSKEERQAMRDPKKGGSQAPRNSRELAVRNQFFTPRYVVEFLTDNTLGRIWYEMTQGETGLKDSCHYLVRRPTEHFLKEGEQPPEQQDSQPDLSQEELLKQPVYIPHRPLKDPRTLKMLDPACGSMHFGLYAFDLFERIYEEAWELEGTQEPVTFIRPQEMEPLQTSYESKEAFLRDVPRLIIEHNIHGIDIDPRAVQIAGLSLWLRAQKSWQVQGVKPQDRPQILRSNVVCAEPMPGEPQFLEEFIENHLAATPEGRLLGQLVRRVFEAMRLAGEAGSLLKIEEEIAESVAEAKEQWLSRPEVKQGSLFGEDPVTPKQMELGLDVSGISDEAFWGKVEERIYAALRIYSEQTAESGGYQRRLFAGDAARGFAFIDLCRKRYDVVLMNPPFGDSVPATEALLLNASSIWCKNLASAFVDVMLGRCNYLGLIGVVSDRTIIVKSSYEKFRREVHRKLFVTADLGWDVLDANVEVTALIFGQQDADVSYFFDERLSTQKDVDLGLKIVGLREEEPREKRFHLLYPTSFSALPNCAFAYDMPPAVVGIFAREASLVSRGNRALQGHNLSMEQFGRLCWEVSPEVLAEKIFIRMYKGGDYSKFYQPSYEVALWLKNGDHLRGHSGTRWGNEVFQEKPGIGYGKRGEFLDAHVMPANHIFTVEGLAIFPEHIGDVWGLLSVLNSSVCSYLLHFYSGQHKMSGYLEQLPIPDSENLSQKTRDEARALYSIKRDFDSTNELSPEFVNWKFLSASSETFQSTAANLVRASNEVRSRGDLLDEWVTEVYGLQYTELCQDSFVSTRPQDIISTSFDTTDLVASRLSLAETLVHYLLGCAFGRWDIRFATGEKPPPELSDPFAPLPACPPGMLQNAHSLPGEPTDVPASYPLRISWPGILVDDESHSEDIACRVLEVLQVIWKDRAETVEQEACEILGVRFLAEYFRKPAGFFADHLKRYSKSRRQAPIYWSLSTPSNSYTIWLYYHRLTDQILYTCVNDFVEPKLKQVAEGVNRLRQKSNRSRVEDKELEELRDLELELKGFRDELLRIAQFWKPNLNDGVQITAAPLWRLFQHRPWQKRLKETWETLEAGEYDWAHLAYSIWPDRVREKCKTDKSLAIAHDLEELCQELPTQPKKKAGRRKKGE